MSASIEREAACACGQLRIRLKGEPLIVSSCHCLACQRRTGALFGSSAFYGRDQVLSTHGQHSSFRRQAESGAWLGFRFCPTCGSTVFWENERLPDVVSVAVGAFADPRFPAPARTVWSQTRHDWLHFPPDMPSHPQAPTTPVPR